MRLWKYIDWFSGTVVVVLSPSDKYLALVVLLAMFLHFIATCLIAVLVLSKGAKAGAPPENEIL
jgi:hypothetical protein